MQGVLIHLAEMIFVVQRLVELLAETAVVVTMATSVVGGKGSNL